MRYFLDLVLLTLGITSASCSDTHKQHHYDKGYEAAGEGEKALSSFWASKEEKEGYENGLDDAWTYDIGYNDGHEGKRPQYFNDTLYMDAYKTGKKDKGEVLA